MLGNLDMLRLQQRISVDLIAQFARQKVEKWRRLPSAFTLLLDSHLRRLHLTLTLESAAGIATPSYCQRKYGESCEQVANNSPEVMGCSRWGATSASDRILLPWLASE